MQHTARNSLPDPAYFAHPARNAIHFGVEPGMSVADFGAGSGAYIWPLAGALAHSGKIFAIDVQRDLLRRINNEAARRGYKNVSVIWADLEQPKASKIKSGVLDFVLVSNLLFQVENKAAVIAEAKRTLRPAGVLALIDWADGFGGAGPRKEDAVTKDVGLELLREGGFDIAREFPAGTHHWGVIARAPKTRDL